MFQFGSDRLVLVLFGSGSFISNYFFAFLSAILDPPFLIFNYKFKPGPGHAGREVFHIVTPTLYCGVQERWL